MLPCGVGWLRKIVMADSDLPAHYFLKHFLVYCCHESHVRVTATNQPCRLVARYSHAKVS